MRSTVVTREPAPCGQPVLSAGSVFRRVDAGKVVQLIPGTLVFGVLLIHEIGVLDAVAVDHGESVDGGFPGDGPGFGGADVG